MRDMDDYFAFKMTSENKESTGGPGCIGSIALWVLVIYAILSLAAEILY